MCYLFLQDSTPTPYRHQSQELPPISHPTPQNRPTGSAKGAFVSGVKWSWPALKNYLQTVLLDRPRKTLSRFSGLWGCMRSGAFWFGKEEKNWRWRHKSYISELAAGPIDQIARSKQGTYWLEVDPYINENWIKESCIKPLPQDVDTSSIEERR